MEKQINTRIVLKNDDLSTLQNSTFIPKLGEAVYAKFTTLKTNPITNEKVPVPTYMHKIGNGEDKFSDLNWTAALAADVFDWAKKENLDVNDIPEIPADKLSDLGITTTVVGDGNIITDVSWDASTKTLTLTKSVLPAQIDYTVTITSTTDGLEDNIAKKYIFTQNGSEIGSIDLAKDLVVTSGSVKEVVESNKPYSGAQVGDKYIELVIANQDNPIYVPAKDLVDIYTPQTNADEVQIAISGTNEISATLTQSVKESLRKADTAIQKVNEATANHVATFDDSGSVKDSGVTIGKSVPADAVFTDTTYELTNTEITNGASKGVMFALEPNNDGSASYIKLVGANGITIVKDGDIYGVIHTNLVDEKTEFTGTTNTLDFGGTFDVETLKYDAHGHVTGIQKNTFTLPDAVDTGIASVVANDTDEKASGLKIDNTDVKNPKIEIDDTIVWVFDCGSATENID